MTAIAVVHRLGPANIAVRGQVTAPRQARTKRRYVVKDIHDGKAAAAGDGSVGDRKPGTLGRFGRGHRTNCGIFFIEIRVGRPLAGVLRPDAVGASVLHRRNLAISVATRGMRRITRTGIVEKRFGTGNQSNRLLLTVPLCGERR